MSKCLQEVPRLLSIKGPTSTPYRTICNGLVKRWNRTLKSMLKRLCQDQPKHWHRLLTNPVPFACREVPQESIGFSPFQLLYERSVRGPGTILKELWTKEVKITEVKTTYEYVTELRFERFYVLKIHWIWPRKNYRSLRNAIRNITIRSQTQMSGSRKPSTDIASDRQ